MATTPQRYYRVEFKVHQHGKAAVLKLALEPTSSIRDALQQLSNVWAIDSPRLPLVTEDLAVQDSEGFWLPHNSPVNCVLKETDKVQVFKSHKRKGSASAVSIAAPVTLAGSNTVPDFSSPNRIPN
jgi:hypothetical protein